MTKLRRLVSLVAVICVLAAVLCGCADGKSTGTTSASGDNSSQEPVSGGEITVGIPQDLDDSLDPHLAVSAGTKEVLFNVFEGLVKLDSDGNLIPAVASAYTMSFREGCAKER